MRFMRFIPFAFIFACTSDPSGGSIMSETNPKPQLERTTYRLSVEDRGKVAPIFDGDALEEFLQMNPPTSRASLLRSFQKQPQLANVDPDGTVSVLVRVSDPAMQRVLDRVWAPRWAHETLTELERRSPDLPGVKTALSLKLKEKNSK